MLGFMSWLVHPKRKNKNENVECDQRDAKTLFLLPFIFFFFSYLRITRVSHNFDVPTLAAFAPSLLVS